MGEYNTTTMDSLFKDVYAKKIENLVPQENMLAKDLPMVPRDAQPGNYFNQPVKLSRSHGVTVSAGGTSYALNDAEPAVTDTAKIQGVSCTIRDVVSEDALAKLAKASGKAEMTRAFVDGTSFVVESIYEAGTFYRECLLMWGSNDIGVTSGRYSDSHTTQVFTFTAATFIPAFWSGMEGGYVDVYDTTGVTKRNSTGTMKVTAVDVANRRVTFLGTEAEMDNIVSTDRFFLRGFLGLSVKGVYDIFSNTGTLFDINAATYSLFAGNTYAVGSGQLVFATALQGMNKPANRGFKGNMDLYVCPSTWNDMNNNLAALRRFGERAKGSVTQGFKGITYESHNGSLTAKSHLLMKPGYAIGVPSGKCKRVGPSDLTFELPSGGGKYFRQLENSAGAQMRAYFNQAAFSANPCHGLVFTGIVNSDQ